MKRLLSAIGFSVLLAGGAAAHPHIFIESGVTAVFDGDGRLVAIRVARVYDEFYSLLIVEDYGLDADQDGVFSPADKDVLRGFDLNLDNGFTGETFVLKGEAPVALGKPREATIDYVDGRLVSTALEPLQKPLTDLDGLVVKTYDPTFYAAYEATGPLAVEGRAGCSLTREPADLDAAYTLVEEILYGPKSDQFSEDNYPEVGEAFADTLHLTCAGSSS